MAQPIGDHRQEFLNKAFELYRKAIQLDPLTCGSVSFSFLAHHNLGVVCSELGRLTDALAAYEKAVELTPDSFSALSNLGNLYLRMGRHRDAKEIFERALGAEQMSPDAQPLNRRLATAFTGLGVAMRGLYDSEGDPELLEQARANCERAVDIDPAFSLAHNNLGVFYDAIGRLEDAAECFNRARELDPSNSVAIGNLRSIKEAQLEQRLFDLGFLKRINKPIEDLTPYHDRIPIEIQGKPVSETILEDRR